MVIFLYKPIYEVYLNGEFVGYSEDKQKLQARIVAYQDKGEEGQEHVAFVQLESMPTYELCLLKKDIVTNDEEIFNMIIILHVVFPIFFHILMIYEVRLLDI